MSDRAYLLSVLLADRGEERRALQWLRHRDALIDLALEDENGYIRYLAAKHVSNPSKGADASAVVRYRKVQSDAAMIVRSAAEELNEFHLFRDKPEQFWKRSQARRLALVNGDDDGEYVTGILRYASKELLPSELITLTEMADVLQQFLGPNFAQTFAKAKKKEDESPSPYPGAMYDLSKSVKALWKLVPDIPQLSYILLGCLPEPPYSTIPPEIIEALDDAQLAHLLWRDDIILNELRRKTFAESPNDKLRRAAMQHEEFELLDSDISKLVPRLDEAEQLGKASLGDLVMLAESSSGATLVQMEAICDLIDRVSGGSSNELCFDAVRAGKQLQTARAKRLPKVSLEQEVFEMRLYELARILNAKADDGVDRHAGTTTLGDFGRLPEKLKTHLQLVTPLDPWSTYLRLRSAVPWEQWKRSKADLPSVYIQNFDLPEDADEDGKKDSSPPASPVFDLVNEVQAKVNGMSELDRAELSALSTALTSISTQMREANVSTGRNVGRLQSRLNIVLWVLGALLLLLAYRFA